MTIKIYTAKHCGPCQEVMRLINEGKIVGNDDDIEVIDIETDDGFAEFNKRILSHSDAIVPSAFKDDKQCKILIEDGETITFDCQSTSLHK